MKKIMTAVAFVLGFASFSGVAAQLAESPPLVQQDAGVVSTGSTSLTPLGVQLSEKSVLAGA